MIGKQKSGLMGRIIGLGVVLCLCAGGYLNAGDAAKKGGDAVKAAVKKAGKAAAAAKALDTTKPVGSISLIKGRAKAKRPGQRRRNVTAGMPVYMGDLIWTGGGNTKLEIKFNDGTKISIGARAKMTIDKFIYDPKSKSNADATCQTSIIKGAFRVVSGKISKIAPDRIKIKTPTATIGIRGTACVGTTNERTTIAVYTEGHSISVSNEFGQTILTGKSGMGCETLAGKAPGPAKMWKIEQVSRMMNMVTTTVVRNAVRAGANAGRVTVAPPSVPHCH